MGGLALATLALLTWWTYSAFTPTIARFLAEEVRPPPPLDALPALKAQFVTLATGVFNFAGLLGCLLTVPLATRLGRRPLFISYSLLSALLLWLAFAPPLDPRTRLLVLGLSGLTVFGIFGAFPFYLPELFPMRLRGTGAGFCYNTGRVLTALGPLFVGVVANAGIAPIAILKWLALLPLVAIAVVLWGPVEETRGQSLG